MAEDRAKQLRKSSTEAEKRLWRLLRAKQLAGYKFRRQEPIGAYIVDFVCFRPPLVIELDGGQHDATTQRAHDELRSNWLATQGFKTIRFWNNQLLENEDGVLHEILGALGATD
ncbi:endonuclease domain-containing protein [Dongia sp.]|uniref:endonuclease domain-containing protein n=1 Tax=Dongia sp. TaxID=1977262 RepID=UPI0035B252BC